MKFASLARTLTFAAALATIGTTAQAADDGGKASCMPDARRLCPAEMRTWSRKKVEDCMIVKIEQTSPGCHAKMLKIKAERGA
jgi:hypothetical protein